MKHFAGKQAPKHFAPKPIKTTQEKLGSKAIVPALATLVYATGFAGISAANASSIMAPRPDQYYSKADSDHDGLADYVELMGYRTASFDYRDTNPNDPDTDDDGINDGDEIKNGTNPHVPDAKPLALAAAAAVAPAAVDTDHDGLTDSEEANLGTDSKKADTDGDGATDFEEVKGTLNKYDHKPTNPLKVDSDGDMVRDGDEFRRGTNPNAQDTDGDSIDDYGEAMLGFNPLVPDQF